MRRTISTSSMVQITLGIIMARTLEKEEEKNILNSMQIKDKMTVFNVLLQR
jgi:hypothetical protein